MKSYLTVFPHHSWERPIQNLATTERLNSVSCAGTVLLFCVFVLIRHTQNHSQNQRYFLGLDILKQTICLKTKHYQTWSWNVLALFFPVFHFPKHKICFQRLRWDIWPSLSSPREARAFKELKRYHTRPNRFNGSPKKVYFGKTYFRDAYKYMVWVTNFLK